MTLTLSVKAFYSWVMTAGVAVGGLGGNLPIDCPPNLVKTFTENAARMNPGGIFLCVMSSLSLPKGGATGGQRRSPQ